MRRFVFLLMITVCNGADDNERFLEAQSYEKSDPDRAALIYKELLPKGYVDVYFKLGCLYYQTGDREQAKSHYKVAADQGDVLAQSNLAIILENEANLASARYYYRLAANQGDMNSQINYAWLCEHAGLFEDASHYYGLASQKGSAFAALKIADLHYKRGAHHDAFAHLSSTALRNNDSSQYYLGLLHLKGHGTEKNEEKAVKCFQDAANLGNEQARDVLRRNKLLEEMEMELF